jgi:hypothetical protein
MSLVQERHVSESTFGLSSVSIANIRGVLGRRRENAIADVAYTGVTCERIDCLRVVCPVVLKSVSSW